MWAPKMSTKGRTGDQRTKDKDGQISNLSSLSLSLSFVSRMHLFTVLLPGRREVTESPVRRRRRESSLLRVSLSICALEMVLLFHPSARARRKQASIRPGKKNKQTNKQKISKSANVAFFSEQRAADFRGFLESFVHKKIKGRREYETLLLLLIR